MWSGVGGVIGMVVGVFVGRSAGWPPTPSAVLGGAVGTAVFYAGLRWIGEVVGRTGVSIVAPSGRSTPAEPDYSFVDALANRGDYGSAAAELEGHADTRPHDPEPALRLARLLRDKLKQPEDAFRWLRRARDVAHDTALEALLTRELVELSVKHLNSPIQAMPDLARLAERHPNDQAGQWARHELAELKKTVGREG